MPDRDTAKHLHRWLAELDRHGVQRAVVFASHFIIPHFGCGFWRETLMLGAQCENVLVDASSSNNWMATQSFDLNLAEVFHRTKAVFGAERILFGTDSGVFPRGWRKDIFLAQQQAMSEAQFSIAEREKAFSAATPHVCSSRNSNQIFAKANNYHPNTLNSVNTKIFYK